MYSSAGSLTKILISSLRQRPPLAWSRLTTLKSPKSTNSILTSNLPLTRNYHLGKGNIAPSKKTQDTAATIRPKITALLKLPTEK
jgi:hypothetical protein